jgi:uncharacterized protein (DUF1684 family)
MNRMRSAMCMSAAIIFAAATMAAQEATDKAADKMDKKSVTGCVQAGSSPGTYVLANAVPAMGDKMASDAASMTKADMGTITLTGTDVDLAPHVGHKVTVTGTMMGKMKDEKASDAAKTAAGMAAGPSLKVKSLTMVSSTCS